MIRCSGKAAFSVLLVTSLSACGQASKATSNYVKANGWSSICLARIGLDLPDKVLVAESEPFQPSGYGFEPGIQGTATVRPTWDRIQIQETNPATLEDLQNLRDGASSRNDMGRITKYAEAPVESKLAYAFHGRYGGFQVGYLDPTDKRIRMFVGGLPVDKQEGEYTVDDLSAYYQELRHLYSARKPTDLPTEPGICTPYGFFKDPSSGPVSNYNIDIAVRSLKYPSLIIFVHIRPPAPNAPKSLDELRDPNNITVDDLQSIKGMGAIGAIAALGNIKKLHEAQKITIAGQPGRLSAREYHHKGTLATTGSGSGAAYEIQADAVGVQGQPDKPAITIKLAAALPDPFPYPPPVRRMSFGEEKIDYYKPARPALKGVKTPPFDEAMTYFKQVLASVRPLPQVQEKSLSNEQLSRTSAASN
jgi:hypothetical protein